MAPTGRGQAHVDEQVVASSEPSKCIISSKEDKSIVCVFCKSHKLDEINWGRMYGTDGVFTHYFCMLFSAALKQNGADDEGILGFLSVDILKEVKRSARLKCTFCGELGASIGCCNKRCKTLFHFPCGLEHGAKNKFHSTFESFCQIHAKEKPFTLNGSVETCPICMGSMDVHSQRLVKGTCCKASLFHKECIQKMALSAGYLFKCPTCNKTKQFIHEMRSMGIFVPDQDASWELDNRFQDLYVQYSHCDAEKCSCSNGRDHVDPKGPWSIARCRLCGAAGVHKRCGKLSDAVADSGKWACPSCEAVEKKAAELAKLKPKPIPPPSAKPSTSRSSLPSTANNRKSKKKQKKPSTANKNPFSSSTNEDSSDDNFTLASCYVSSRCFSYFPYPRSRLRKMKRTTLPDWRDLELRVNLVKWIPELIGWKPADQESFFPSAVPSTSTSSSSYPTDHSSTKISQSPSSSSAGRRRSASPTIIELEAEEVLSDMMRMEYQENVTTSTRPRTRRTTGFGKSRKRRSLWSTGVHRSSKAKQSRLDRSKSLSCTVTSFDLQCESMEAEEVKNSIQDVKIDTALDTPASATSVSPTLSDIFNMVVESEVEVEQVPQQAQDVETQAEVVASPARSIVEEKEEADVSISIVAEVEVTSISMLEDVMEEPTPEQMTSFKAMGNRLRTELSQNNRENEFSPSKGQRLTFFPKELCTDRRKQWLCPESIKERQALLGEPELSNVQ